MSGRTYRRRLRPALIVALALLAPSLARADVPGPDAETRNGILAHGPWPAVVVRDASNRASGRAEAITFGELLFHSARLSTVGGMRCASCHEPWRALADGRARALGAEPVERNTPSLLNVAHNRWFGWDGARDNLWSQSVRPLLDPREMRASAAHVATLVREDADLRRLYGQAFGALPPDDDDALLVDVGKALAAFEETLVSARTPFDGWRDALQRGDEAAAASYPRAAERGARLFDGRAKCATCHSGPTFSDGGFHRSLIESRGAGGGPDEGRAAGLRSLRADPRNLLGRYNDGAGEPRARVDATRQATAAPGGLEVGFFRTPGLREVAATGPYMHDGSVANLCDALRPHAVAAEGEGAAELSLAERRDLVAFLRSLSARPEAVLVDPAIYRCR